MLDYKQTELDQRGGFQVGASYLSLTMVNFKAIFERNEWNEQIYGKSIENWSTPWHYVLFTMNGNDLTKAISHLTPISIVYFTDGSE